MRIATVQLEITEAQPIINRGRVLDLLRKHAEFDLCLLPELWTSGYCYHEWRNIAQNDTPLTINWMSDVAKNFNIWLGGSVVCQDENGRLFNRFLLFNRQGMIVGSYDKTHLFTLMKEHKYLSPGQHLSIIDVEGYKVALAICYDLRFPEMFRKLFLQGVDMFLVPCEWPASRKDILFVLAATRAIEAQAYLILANRVGHDDKGTVYAGMSAIFGPEGIINETKSGVSELIISTLDKNMLTDIRKNFPLMKHRREGIDYDN